VIVLSDGDANIGSTSHQAILATIDGYRRKGITLSTVGLGTGNYNDQMMEQLANKGDGNYSYIADEKDADRVFVEQVGGLLEVIASDVKVQVQLNPSVVTDYRLVGYENRDVADVDFRNDAVDGGEIGAGHSVTAMYEVTLRDVAHSPLTVSLRYKPPQEGDEATETSVVMRTDQMVSSFAKASDGFRFATAVIGFAEVLRGSEHAARWSLDDVERIARGATEMDEARVELADLVHGAKKAVEESRLERLERAASKRRARALQAEYAEVERRRAAELEEIDKEFSRP
jgi:Ca-activated chloride channel family protein